MGSHLVALLGGFGVALIGGEQEPLIGLRVILFHAAAACVEDGEVVLAVGDAAIGSLAEPIRRRAVIGRAVDTLGVKHGEVMHGLAVALVGGGEIEVARGGEVFLHAKAFF